MNKKHTSLIVLLLALATAFCACSDNSETKDLIGKEKMQNMMLDIIMAESYATMVKDSARHERPKNPDSLALFYKRIFAHHNVEVDEFLRTLEWYKHHPTELDSLVNELLPRAKRWQDSLK